MDWLEIILWISVVIVFYSFLGYGLLLYLLVILKKRLKHPAEKAVDVFEPEVTLVIPCFNEADIMEGKIANCRELDYPVHKLSLVFVTDGSRVTS